MGFRKMQPEVANKNVVPLLCQYVLLGDNSERSINFVMEKISLQRHLALLPSVEHPPLDFTLAHTIGILTRQEWNGRI